MCRGPCSLNSCPSARRGPTAWSCRNMHAGWTVTATFWGPELSGRPVEGRAGFSAPSRLVEERTPAGDQVHSPGNPERASPGGGLPAEGRGPRPIRERGRGRPGGVASRVTLSRPSGSARGGAGSVLLRPVPVCPQVRSTATSPCGAGWAESGRTAQEEKGLACPGAGGG